MTHEEIRLPVLKKIAEQAMSDEEFRRVAARDLDAALINWGYVLNSRELTLVHKFRATLAEAGVDLMLNGSLDIDSVFDQTTPDDLERMIKG